MGNPPEEEAYHCTKVSKVTDDLIPKNRRCRNQHSLVFQIPTASKDAYKKSFFPQTIRDWNVLPDSLISSAELSDDCVSKFTSLVNLNLNLNSLLVKRQIDNPSPGAVTGGN